jgi:hypothetical protein
MTTIRINPEPLLDLLGDNGEHWLQGGWGNDDRMCLHGAIRRCQPVPGDAYLIEQVANRKGWGTSWNDDTGTRWDDVKALILAGVEVTDADLDDTFGPQWEQFVALVRRAAVLTHDEALRMDAARAAARDAAWALAVRDLIGQHGFTQAHYDLLTEPWRTVIGPIHPEDARLLQGESE